MFEMDGKPDAAEVHFSQRWEKAVQQLHTIESKSKLQQAMTVSRASNSKRKSAVGIASMAAASVMSTSVTGIVDLLLTSPDLPSLPDLKLPEQQLSSSFIAGHFRQLSIPVMVLLDLACSHCSSHQSCIDLLEMAFSRLQQSDEVPVKADVNREDVTSLSGIGSFLTRIHQFSTSSSGVSLSDNSEIKQDELELPARTILTECRWPVDPATFQSSQKSLREISARVTKLIELLQQESNDSVEAVQLPMSGPSKLPPVETIQKASGYLLQFLDKFTGTIFSNVTNSKDDGSPSDKTTNYFLSIFKHACILASLQLEARDWQPGEVLDFSIRFVQTVILI